MGFGVVGLALDAKLSPMIEMGVEGAHLAIIVVSRSASLIFVRICSGRPLPSNSW
jgi:hypothetical protein